MNTDKIQEKKPKKQVSEIEFVDKIIFGIQDLEKARHLLRWLHSYNTTTLSQKPSKIFQKLVDNEVNIYLGEYEGWYSVS